MATIRERKNSEGGTRYQVIVRLKGQKPQTATFTRKTDAAKWAKTTEAAILEGRHFKTTESKKHTLADLIDRYIRDVLPDKKPSARLKQAPQLLWWKDALGHLTLADTTPAAIGEARDKLRTGRAPATVNRYMAAISHAFTIAANEWGWLEDNPMRKVRKPTEPQGRVRFLNDDERKALLNACKQSECEELYTVVVLAISTGMRQGEIMNLRWEQIDQKRGYIFLHETKNGERRTVPLVGHAFELIQERAKIRRLDTTLIFPSHTKPTAPIAIRRPWGDAVRVAELSDFRFHDLRHTAASYLAMNGASLAELAEILGHKTLQMVKRYAHLSEQHTSKVLESMNNRIFS